MEADRGREVQAFSIFLSKMEYAGREKEFLVFSSLPLAPGQVTRVWLRGQL